MSGDVPNWWGDIPTWLTTIAALFALWFGIEQVQSSTHARLQQNKSGRTTISMAFNTQSLQILISQNWTTRKRNTMETEGSFMTTSGLSL
jgi:hypothetical protein